MSDLLVHKSTKNELNEYLKNPAHAVVLTGAKHSGKGYIASYISERINGGNEFITTRLNCSEIGIDEVRKIITSLQLKTFDKNEIRVLILEDIDKLRHEAQNALLKILEEPPENVHFVCTTSQPNAVLPTVISRMTVIHVKPISIDQARKYFNEYTEKEIIKAHSVSDGAAAMMIGVLRSKEHEALEAIDWAKEVLRKNRYERLLLVDELASKDVEVLHSYISALQKVLKASILHTKNLSNSDVKKRIFQLSSVLDAKQKLLANTNSKLVFTTLFSRI